MNIKRVVLMVEGGAAEVLACPADTVVEINDYDTDECDPGKLEPDGSVKTVIKGPCPDPVTRFAMEAAQELAEDGMEPGCACGIAADAERIIHSHEQGRTSSKKTGLEPGVRVRVKDIPELREIEKYNRRNSRT